jgi:hypothetical protein
MATFKETFAAKRKELGAGKTFTWNGKSYTTDRADDKKPAPTASNKPKARPAAPQSGASQSGTAGKVAPKAAPKESMSGASRSAAGKVKPKVDMPKRPITPTRDSGVTGRYSKYEAARLGNYTKSEFDALSRSQREAKGLPISWIDYVRVGGNMAVKNPKSTSSKIMSASAKVGAVAGDTLKKILNK